MNRVCIVGCNGAGKSVFAKKLKKLTGLPLYHLDHIYWKPGWIEQSRAVFDRELAKILEREQWITDGNFSRTMDVRFKSADTVFFLDFPVWLCLLQIIKRIMMSYGRSRDDMAAGCPENFDLDFLAHVAKFKRVRRPVIVKALEDHAKHCQIFVLKNHRDIKNWLKKHETY